MPSLQTKPALVLLTLVVTLGLAGCGPKEFTADDFSKVKKDMPPDKVAEIIGKPKETVDVPAPLEIKFQFYESKGAYYVVTFTKDGSKVLATDSFSDKGAYDKMIAAMKATAK